MTDWLDALDFVHGLCGTRREMETSCYLYQQKEAYCIGDVIRRRREMLGMTKKELCDGICSEKTIGRLEANKTKPQIEIVRLLFEKLNLSGEYQRAQIVSKDVKASIIVGEIGVYTNKRDYKRVEELLKELEQYISLENPINRQYKEHFEARIKSGYGKMSKEESAQCYRQILEYTIPFEAILKTEEKYLTNVEMQCLLNIAICGGKSNDNIAFDILLEVCKQLETDEGIIEHIGVWELVMTHVANIYGDRNEYDKSDAVSIKTMIACIHCYRMRLLDMHLYISAWNYNERKKKNIPLQQGYKVDVYLKKCIALCQINKNNAREIMVKEQFMKLL